MASILEVLGETFMEGALGPIVLVGIGVSLLSSREMRRKVRQWSVHGLAAAMTASDMAATRFRTASNGSGGIVKQLGQRVMQAASEVREEWDDFVAEARTASGERKTQPPATQERIDGDGL